MKFTPKFIVNYIEFEDGKKMGKELTEVWSADTAQEVIDEIRDFYATYDSTTRIEFISVYKEMKGWK